MIPPNNFIIILTMKKPFSQVKISDSTIFQEDGVYALKVLNFDLKIQSSPFRSNPRYSHQQKIMRRRQMVQTAISRYDKSQYNPQNDRRVRSSNQVRVQSDQKLNKLKALQQLNQQIQILTPILDEKIVELKNSMFRKSSSARKSDNKQHNVHFTEYVLRGAFPTAPTVLHSRKKRDCPFMKSVKARSLMNKSAEGKPRLMIQDLFKSIELNNSSKYASSKQISVSGGNITKNIKSSKNRGSFGKQVSKGYADRRQALIARRQKIVSPQKKDQCRPWETHHGFDGANQDDIIHL